jgi:hypothetical protein
MGIRFQCPNGHSLNVKTFLAGKRGICPECDARFIVPLESGGRVEAIDEPNSILLSALVELTPDLLERTPLAGDPLLASLEITPVQNRLARRKRNRSLTLGLSALVVLLALVMILVLWKQL